MKQRAARADLGRLVNDYGRHNGYHPLGDRLGDEGAQRGALEHDGNPAGGRHGCACHLAQWAPFAHGDWGRRATVGDYLWLWCSGLGVS